MRLIKSPSPDDPFPAQTTEEVRPLLTLDLTKAPRWHAASTAVIRAAWGALGGATNALTTRMRRRDALRHILLGGLIAAGMGSLSMAVIMAWLALPPAAYPTGGAAGSAAYLIGVFGPAFIESEPASWKTSSGRFRRRTGGAPDMLARLRTAKGGEDD